MAQPSLCPASPKVIAVHQPDGSFLSVRGVGNALVSYTETPDGYTLFKDDEGFYEYAFLLNGELHGTGIKAHDLQLREEKEQSFLIQRPRHLRANSEKILNKAKQQRIAGEIQKFFPSKGTHKTIMLLIDFPDLPHKYADTDFVNMMNKANYKGIGSFHDYYLNSSLGQLNLTTDVAGWYTAKHGYLHYGKDSGYDKAADLVVEAINAAIAKGVDFSQYDNDGDGIVEGLIIAHAGEGAEIGNQTQLIWSHRALLSSYNKTVTTNGVELDYFSAQPERLYGGMIEIGVYCHEFGHVLGLPDLYDVDYSSDGIGNWSLMASGAYLNDMKTPAGFDAWCKVDLKWVTPKLIDTSKVQTYTLRASSNTPDIFKIKTDSPGEYYLLENRQNIGFDAYLPGHGLAIWHIDTVKTSLFRMGGNNLVNAEEHNRGVDLVQADGKDELSVVSSRGDAGDLYPGSSANQAFTPSTNPSPLLHDEATPPVMLENITENFPTVTFGFSNRTCAARVTWNSNKQFCKGESVDLTASSAASYQWFLNGTPITGALGKTYSVNDNNLYSVKISDSQGCTARSSSHRINFIDIPTPVVSIKSINLLQSSSPAGNQWILNGADLPGDTSRQYVPKTDGTYQVRVTKGPCSVISKELHYTLGSANVNVVSGNTEVNIYPNPVAETLFIDLSQEKGAWKADIMDVSGRTVRSAILNKGRNQINMQGLAPGMYILKCKSAESFFLQQIIRN